MATLGEAFIAVKADMAPFRRGLKKEVQDAADAIEKDLSTAISKGLEGTAEKAGEEAGKKAGDGFAKGSKSKLGDKKNSPWVEIIGAFGAALDDGLSALPTEIKATIVLALLAISPLIAGAISAAIVAGIGAGVATLGVALASQFTVVRERWTQFVSTLRETLVGTALPFEAAILTALTRVEQRLGDFVPLLENIFREGAGFLMPIVDGALDALEEILSAIETEIPNMEDFVKELAVAFKVLGIAIADAIQILTSTGRDGQRALRDLAYLIAGLIVASAELLAALTKVYGTIRDIAKVAPIFGIFTLFIAESDSLAKQNQVTGDSNRYVEETFSGVIEATKKEEKALKELNTQMEAFIKDQFDAVDAQIAFEEAVDELTESFRENGRTIDIETKAGRENLTNLGNAIKAAQRANEERVASGKMSAADSHKLMLQEIEEIYRIAAAFGISRKAVDEYYGSVVAALNVPGPSLAWAHELAYLMTLSANEARRYNRERWGLDPNRLGGNQPFAEGGIVYGPTNALIGEAGAEVVIPLTRPARARQLLEQSGLSGMLFGGSNVAVQVFIGNEELDARTVRIVNQSASRQARSLAFGART